MALYQRVCWRFANIILLTLIAALPALSQTTEELNRKYKQLGANQYQVQPEAVLTVKSANNGQICEMILEPRSVSDTKLDSNGTRELPQALMQVEVAEKIIDELLPASPRRSRLINGGSFESGCNEVSVSEYEHVVIERVFHHCQKEFGEVVSVRIQLKKTECNGVGKRTIEKKSER